MRGINRLELLFGQEPPTRPLTMSESAVEDLKEQEDQRVLKALKEAIKGIPLAEIIEEELEKEASPFLDIEFPPIEMY